MIGNITGIGKTTSGSTKGLYIVMLYCNDGYCYAYTFVNKPITSITELRNYVEENGIKPPYENIKTYPCLGGSNYVNTVEMYVDSNRTLKVNLYRSNGNTDVSNLTYYGITQLI